MKHFRIGAACALSFALGALFSPGHTRAQSNQPNNRLYYEIDYMKSRLGQDPIKMEEDLWKPIHQERLKNGDIVSWAVMAPRFAGPRNYDYVTVEGFHSLGDLEKTNYPAVFTKIWGKEKSEAAMKRTDDTRDLVGSDVYVVIDSIGGSGK